MTSSQSARRCGVVAMMALSGAAHAEEPATPTEQAIPLHQAPAPVAPDGLQFRPGTGLHVESRDGRFSLGLRLRMQILYVLQDPVDDDPEQTMSIRRLRLVLAGKAYFDHVRYYVQFGFANRDMLIEGDSRRTPIRDVRIDLTPWRDLSFRIGETKVPFSRERLTSSAELQFVDRSLTNEEFNLDRDVGVQVFSKDLGGRGWLGYAAGVFLGEGRGAVQPSGIDLLYTARVELFPFGMFEHETMVDFDRGGLRAALGFAYAYLQAAKRDRGPLGDIPDDGGTTDTHNAVADLVVKAHGASSLFAFHYRDGTRNPGGAVDDLGVPIPVELPRSGWGLLAQAGYLIPCSPVELSGRFTRVRGIGDTSLPDRDEATAGVGWYVADHSIKVQLDYAHTWLEGASQEHRLRLQTQLSL